jgi:hypothetical protein
LRRHAGLTLRGMRVQLRAQLSISTALIALAVLASSAVALDGETQVELQPDTKGCNGVLPSTDGNTDMRLVGGTLWPGGTAVFEITYPLNASSVGKEFTILACAFINDVATLKYVVSFVPSNQAFRLRMTFAVPEDAPVGGTYCNYVKTTAAPTAAQASQRKAGPACFVIRPRPGGTPPSDPPGGGSSSNPPGNSDPPGGGGTPALPDTAMRR